MALSLQLLQKQTQRLIMTPQMQQSIQLLQLNTVELEQLTQNEMRENPFLQLEEDRGDTEVETSEVNASENSEDLKTEAVKDGEGDKVGEDIFAPIEAEVNRMDAAQNAPLDEPAAMLNGAEAPAEDMPPTLEEKPENFKEVDINWEEFFEGAENRTYIAEPVEERPDFSEYTAARQSLYDHLLWQLRLSTLEDKASAASESRNGVVGFP